MKMLKVMEKRRSVREYKEKDISKGDLDSLMKILQGKPQLEKGHDVDLVFLEDGQYIQQTLQGVAGYNGVMIKAPHYFAVMAKSQKNHLAAAGYLTEWFVLNATKHDLGTCWIETMDKSDKVKELLQIKDSRDIIALLAIGYPAVEHRVSNIFTPAPKSSLPPSGDIGYPNRNIEYSKEPISARISIEEMVYLKNWGNQAHVETLESYGLAEAFYYMHLAPSWGNLQPWRFIVDGSNILLVVKIENPYLDESVDPLLAELESGIAMLYFEVAMHDLGLPGHWNLEVPAGSYGVPEGYLLAGMYSYQ